jgi:competence protein ComEC
VLRITAASGSLLLTGDIEASDEAAIVARHGRLLASDVIVPPHHGSRGASTAAFVAAVNARLAIFSAGYRNRFGHPVAEVVDRYRAGGAQIRRTDQEGAVSLELGRDGVVTAAERERRRRYWLAD